MKKEIVSIILAVLVLAGCSKKKADSDNGSGENSVTREPETCGVSDSGDTPDSQNNMESSDKAEETGGPVVPDVPGEIRYADSDVVIFVDDEGTSYVNGKPASSEEVSKLLSQIVSDRNASSDAPDTTTKKVVHIPADTLPDLPEITVTEPPKGPIYINGDEYFLAKYVKTGNTDLAITDVKVFSNLNPGNTNVDAFKPGDTMMVNLKCSPEAARQSTLYIVPEGAKHKDSYTELECLAIYNMDSGFESGENQYFLEAELPAKLTSGVYELRFCCGGEEGYIPFYIG